jgi:hypothetical protein
VVIEDRVPEEPELTGETLSDPFWQTVIGAHRVEAEACERALIAQTEMDTAWHQETTDRLTADGLTGDEFNAAFTAEMLAYFGRARSRCMCGDHRPTDSGHSLAHSN